jgi:predicted small lipoprotein YifL
MSRYLKAMSLLALSSGIALAGCGQSAPENAPKGKLSSTQLEQKTQEINNNPQIPPRG